MWTKRVGGGVRGREGDVHSRDLRNGNYCFQSGGSLALSGQQWGLAARAACRLPIYKPGGPSTCPQEHRLRGKQHGQLRQRHAVSLTDRTRSSRSLVGLGLGSVGSNPSSACYSI